ncbi:MAG: hypothetical protein ACRDFR_06630 [Candidatus Limnocylindria bacterium]
MSLTRQERRQLAAIVGCEVRELSRAFKPFEDAAREEYERMVLGQAVFTRGQDIREYRLYLIIKHVYGGNLPDERTISGLFQTTRTQSRALLRAVMSKYQYELQAQIQTTLRDVVDRAEQDPETEAWSITIDSENVIEALNREIAAIDGTLPQVSKRRGTVSTWEIPNSSIKALKERIPTG